MTTKIYKNISEIYEHYETFIIDLWGVIHDGSATYNGVIECLEKLKEKKKKVIFLSNAPRRAYKVKEQLKRLCISEELFKGVVTSGESTYEYIKARGKEYGSNYYMIGPDKDTDLISDLDYKLTKSPENADFIITTGFKEGSFDIETVMPDLEISLENNLTLMCANPDDIVIKKTGDIEPCAGYVGKQYQKMGGNVIYFGKPYPEVYKNNLFPLIESDDFSKIAIIGDSLETDIKGGISFNIDSYLISGGILLTELKINHGEIPDETQLNEIFKKYNIYPKATLPEFRW